jgi:hypothetical protein
MIKSFCSECDAQSIDGIMKHAKGCSALLFEPKIEDYVRPPGITLKFDSPEEQAEWLRKLNGSSGEHQALRKLAPKRKRYSDGK